MIPQRPTSKAAEGESMRVAILSSTQFGLRCLSEGITAISGVQVAGIMTTPQQINISYSEKPVDIKTHANFSEIARVVGCEIAVMNGPVRTRDYLASLDRWRPHLLLALGWYYNIPKAVRDSTQLGCTGIHASLLPRFRGGAPINWAIIQGESETGVTFFHLTDEIDAGDVIAQQAFAIDSNDTCATLYEKAEQASVDILRTWLPKLAGGTAPRVPQDHSQATQFPQRNPDDGLINWSWNGDRIRNFIRAQTRPYPGAYFIAGRHKVIVWDATIAKLSESEHLRETE